MSEHRTLGWIPPIRSDTHRNESLLRAEGSLQSVLSTLQFLLYRAYHPICKRERSHRVATYLISALRSSDDRSLSRSMNDDLMKSMERQL